MSHNADVEVVTIGDELVLGFTVDTNAAFLSRELAGAGVSVARRTTVGDSMDAIVSAVTEALDRTGAVITTGGLGPTSDDFTKDAVARVFGRNMSLDEAHLAWMRERWRTRFAREMPESNVRQAMMPDGARKLENKHGSAPGVLIEDARGWVVMLPGVPRELRGMTGDVVLPLVRERFGGAARRVIKSRTLRTTGVAESLLADKLASVRIESDSGAKVTLAYLPGIDGVDLRTTVFAADAAAADRELERLAAGIRDAVGESIYGEDEADLAAVLLDLCRSRHQQIAVAESCTGGLLGARLTAIPGSSDVFAGGVIAYANAVKVRELAVSEDILTAHGAVSEEVVRAMATGVRSKFGTELGFAITGVAGPGGGTPEKPVGLVWIAVATGTAVEARKLHSWGDRQEIRYRASQATMELARRLLS